MTPQDVITEVRRLIQDEVSPYRYSDTVLLGFVNQILKRMALLRPDLFAFIGDISITADEVLQTLPSNSIRLVEIYRVKNGNAMTEVSRETLDQSTPNWVAETAGTPVNYVRHVRNPNKYFLYPPPVSGTVLVGEYVQTPSDYGLTATISVLPDAYFSTLVDGVVYLAESVDNEHVNSGRAKLFFDSFTQSLGVALQSRVLTDTESGGMDPKQVI
jgi:hypothetical protein